MVDLMPAVDRSPPIDDAILTVSDLRVSFQTPHGVVRAVSGVSLGVRKGEALGILGESGSGKSVSVGAIMGLLDSPPAEIEGEIHYGDIDLLRAPARTTRRIRGDRVSMVYQDAVTALNPSLTVGYQIGEMFRVHRPGTSRRDATRKAIELMDRVHIPSAAQRVHNYPFEFSGGMSQRIMIAMAIALEPDILIADEPTTALDVTVQAQIMRLLAELRDQTGMALILITHDIGLIAENSDRVMVMYAGRVMESGPTAAVVARPAHPYTEGLMESVPREEMKHQKLVTIEGSPPVLTAMPSGCAFHPRCRRRQPICVDDEPALRQVAAGRDSACHFAMEVLDG
ncbi:ABC transporter ATP-binding protein [Bauldia sp.]|uniref:ABC transporter ATP-binding protein n=1 Tax=Bauldia sp. TaxID=2575872 RepID=UPI003BA90BAA